MLAFQREVFKTELKNKLAHWKSPAGKASFYGKLPVSDVIPDFGIIRDGSGYFHLRDDLVAYYDLTNGLIIRIRKNWSAKDWNCYQALYQKSLDEKTFRVDIPLYREELLISDGTTWEYAELRSPGSNYGTNLFNDAFPDIETGPGVYVHDNLYENNRINPVYIPDSVREDTTAYIRQHIDDTYQVAHQAALIARENNCGLPESIGNIANRYKDNQGYFWSDLDQAAWNLSKDHFMMNALTVLGLALDMLHGVSHLTAAQRDQCLAYAREKWVLI